jgi:predicted helicase
LNEVLYRTPKFFPAADAANRVILLEANGRTAFAVLMTDVLPSLNVLDASQCFPRYYYENPNDPSKPLEPGDIDVEDLRRLDAVTDESLDLFQTTYSEKAINKDDLFYYTYGLLHSEDYRTRYGTSLSKQLPRLPLTLKAEEFWAFVKAGRELGELHIGFEAQDIWQGLAAIVDADAARTLSKRALHRVEGMKFAGKRPNADKSTILYNSNIRVSGIPLEAYDYVVNGRSAIEWVMERQSVTTDGASGIVNDANDYANETKNDPEYPLKLLLSVITVSMKTLEIVRSLPKLGSDGSASNTRRG